MAQTSTRSRRGKSSRKGRGLKITLGILLVLLVLIVLNAFALNNETETAALTTSGATLVETTSGPLQVVDAGTPPLGTYPENDAPPPATLPIVLIHGSGGAINWWDDLIPLLSPDHRVIAIDLLGYGGSAKPGSGYSIDSQAGLVAQVLAGIQVDSAVAVGHSLGGKVVTALAEQSPDLVAGVTIIDTGPDSSFGDLSGAAKLAQMPLIGPALWRIAPDFMIRRNVSQGFAPGYDVPDKYVEDIREMTYPAYHESFNEQEKYTDAVPLNERLETTGKPLLIIFGAEDQIFPAREALSAYAAIPGVTTKLIQDSGHSPQIEAPEETAKAISTFADSLAPKTEPKPEPKPKPDKKDKRKSGDKASEKAGSKKKSNAKQADEKNQTSKAKQKNQKEQANQKAKKKQGAKKAQEAKKNQRAKKAQEPQPAN